MPPTLAHNDRDAPVAPLTSLGLQKQALISFYTGSDEEARASLDAVKRQMPTTRMMDPQALLVMAITSFRSDRLADLAWCYTASTALLEQTLNSEHALRIHCMIGALAACGEGGADDVSPKIDEIIARHKASDFTLDVASSVVMVLATIASKFGPIHGAEDAILKIGMRYCGVIAATEMLCRAAWVYPRYADLVRQAHGSVLKIAQAAISRSVAGHPAAAIDELARHAQRLGNAKLIESARIAVHRNLAALANETELIARVSALSTRGGGISHTQDCASEKNDRQTSLKESPEKDFS